MAARGQECPRHTCPRHTDSAAEVRVEGDIHGIVDAAEAELRSAGRPGAAVPTQTVVTSQVVGTAQTFEAVPGQELEASAAHAPIEISAQAESRIPGNLVINLAISDIDKNPFQTRYVEDDEALEELADSIKANGVVQPIVVRPSEEDEGRYILILGERRLHASKKAGKTHIPALVRRVSLQQAAEMTIIENLQREDLSPLEQAEAFRVLSSEFNLTQQQIGERVGLSRASIANYMRSAEAAARSDGAAGGEENYFRQGEGTAEARRPTTGSRKPRCTR